LKRFAAYLTAAQEQDRTLVTDDEKLINAARKIRVKTSPRKKTSSPKYPHTTPQTLEGKKRPV